MYDSYQSLLNGLDLLVQVCHNFPSPAVRNENGKVSAVTEGAATIKVDTVDGKNVCVFFPSLHWMIIRCWMEGDSETKILVVAVYKKMFYSQD